MIRSACLFLTTGAVGGRMSAESLSRTFCSTSPEGGTTMKAIVLAGIALAFSMPGHATTLNVPDQFPTIQSAIVAAASGDTVLVEPGTYDEIIDFLGKGILVASWYILEEDTTYTRLTTIDASTFVDASVARFVSGETRSSRLSGFTIRGGSGQPPGGGGGGDGGGGGGVYCSYTSPTLDHLRIVGNSALAGGGIYVFDGDPLVRDCYIANNWADYVNGYGGDGGGIYARHSGIAIENSEIHGNHAEFRGAGIFCEHSSQIITGNRITGNIIDRAYPEYTYGGGLASRNCVPIISDNYIADNFGGSYGGGVFY
jgi:hypothetical protein